MILKNLILFFKKPVKNLNIKDEYEKMIEIILKNKLALTGLVVVEHSIKMKLKNIVGYLETRKYGNNCFSLFKKKQACKPDSV